MGILLKNVPLGTQVGGEDVCDQTFLKYGVYFNQFGCGPNLILPRVHS